MVPSSNEAPDLFSPLARTRCWFRKILQEPSCWVHSRGVFRSWTPFFYVYWRARASAHVCSQRSHVCSQHALVISDFPTKVWLKYLHNSIALTSKMIQVNVLGKTSISFSYRFLKTFNASTRSSVFNCQKSCSTRDGLFKLRVSSTFLWSRFVCISLKPATLRQNIE